METENKNEKIFSKEDVMKIINKSISKTRVASHLAELAMAGSDKADDIKILNEAMNCALDTIKTSLEFETENYFNTTAERKQYARERIGELLNELLGEENKD